MIKKIIILPAVLLIAIFTFNSCSFGDSAIPVNDLTVTKVEVVEKTSTTTDAPVSYNVTVSWDTTDIYANETTADAITGIRAYIEDGISEELDIDVTTYTFENLLPGDYTDLRIEAIYIDGTFPDASFSDYTDDIGFTGGPWYDGTETTAPDTDSGFGVGSFNHMDSMPSSSYSIDDVYYYNSYNTDYQFEAVNDVIWLIVNVNEVTDSNDTDTQRNNVQWLNKNFQMVDASLSDLNDYDDIAKVDVEIIDIYGDSLLSISGTDTEGTMSTTNFSTLISSVDSGYYAESTGYYFIKATCTSMPSTYSESNSEDKLGLWGIANNGSRR